MSCNSDRITSLKPLIIIPIIMVNIITGILPMGATFTLAAFPPTSAAARQNYLRTYLQVQQWLGRDLPPTEWGWKYHNNSPISITTDLLDAPQKLMKVISCNCKAGCTSTLCGCRQAGMPCSAMCSKCMGTGYSNTPLAEDDCATGEDEL